MSTTLGGGRSIQLSYWRIFNFRAVTPCYSVQISSTATENRIRKAGRCGHRPYAVGAGVLTGGSMWTSTAKQWERRALTNGSMWASTPMQWERECSRAGRCGHRPLCSGNADAHGRGDVGIDRCGCESGTTFRTKISFGNDTGVLCRTQGSSDAADDPSDCQKSPFYVIAEANWKGLRQTSPKDAKPARFA